jgi:integrase
MRGAAVIRYDGKRGVVWRIKYRDAEDKQVMETLGAESDGWTRKKAQAELRERLVRVERKGYRRPAPLTFGEYADDWFAAGKSRRGWKPRTLAQYVTVQRRLVDHFGSTPLAAIRPRHVAEYVTKLSKTHGASSVGRDLNVLHAIFRTAVREELVDANPATGAERPKLPRRNWRILEPTEVQRVYRAFADDTARVAFLTLVLTGVRRSELQALRWRDVDLIANVLRVRDSKSEDGIRSIAISPTLAEELWQHRRRSTFQGDDERVFCHPTRGTIYRIEPFHEHLSAALAAAGVDAHGMRPCHDLRHTAITNDAAAGSNPIAVKTKAGHASLSTTMHYIHLAGVVFHDEASALESRMLGEPSTPVSTHPGRSEKTLDDLSGSTKRQDVARDAV